MPFPILQWRHRQLLAFLGYLGGILIRDDLQNMLFLYFQEQSGRGANVQSGYEFVPRPGGVYSYSCESDCQRMERIGLLSLSDSAWSLTRPGKEAASEFADYMDASCLEDFRDLRGESLVAETIRRRPYDAANRISAERLLPNGGETTSKHGEQPVSTTEPMLMTIGYEGRSLEHYLNRLLLSGVSLLIDVRRNAISRKFGFSKRTLSGACQDMGIRYRHLPELGIESDLRRRVHSAADLQTLFANYESRTLSEQAESVRSICQLVSHGERVALTCFEREAAQCHRHKLASAVAQALRQPVDGLQQDELHGTCRVSNL